MVVSASDTDSGQAESSADESVESEETSRCFGGDTTFRHSELAEVEVATATPGAEEGGCAVSFGQVPHGTHGLPAGGVAQPPGEGVQAGQLLFTPLSSFGVTTGVLPGVAIPAFRQMHPCPIMQTPAVTTTPCIPVRSPVTEQ